MLVKLEDGRIKDVAVKDVTKENYIIEDNEKHLYHCVIEVKKFNAETGERLSVPRIQKFGKKAFDSMLKANLVKQGYTITILHDPTEWIEENKANAIKAKEEAKQKAIDEAVAEALAKAEEEKQEAIKQAVAEALKAKKTTKKKADVKTEAETIE